MNVMSSINDSLENLPFDHDNTLNDIEAAQTKSASHESSSENAFLAYAEDAHTGLTDEPLPLSGIQEPELSEPNKTQHVPESTIPLVDIPTQKSETRPIGEVPPLVLTENGLVNVNTQTDASPEQVLKRKAIRTYQSDVAETMHGEQVSLTDIALAEQRKAEEKRRHQEVELQQRQPAPLQSPIEQEAVRKRAGLIVPPRFPTPAPLEPTVVVVTDESEKVSIGNIVGIVIGIVLLVAAIGVMVFVYGAWQATRTPVVVTEVVPDVGIVVESVSVIPVGVGTSRSDLIKSFEDAVNETGGVRGDVVGIVYQVGTSTRMTAQQFMDVLDTSAEDQLVRTLLDRFVAGVHITDAEHGFLVFKTSLFENAFAGMLAWEETLLRDLPFLRNSLIVNESALAVVVPNATTTDATTTTDVAVVVPQDPLYGAVFRDVVVENKNARALYTQRGEIVLIYSFPDTETLVITSNVQTLKELYSRLAATRFSR